MYRTSPAAQDISVYSKLPMMHRLFLSGAPLHWCWKGPLHLQQNTTWSVEATHRSLLVPVLPASGTWVEQDDGPEAAQLCFVHLHISHFIDELSENSKGMGNEKMIKRLFDLITTTYKYTQ